MCRPFRSAFSTISLRIKIWCTVFLSVLNPACYSDTCIPTSPITPSSAPCPHCLGAHLFCNCYTLTGLFLFGNMMITDFIYFSGTLPFMIADDLQLFYNILTSGLDHPSSNFIDSWALVSFAFLLLLQFLHTTCCSSFSLDSGVIRLSYVTPDWQLPLSV